MFLIYKFLIEEISIFLDGAAVNSKIKYISYAKRLHLCNSFEYQMQRPSAFSTPPNPLSHFPFSHQRAEGRPTNCKRKQRPLRRTVLNWIRIFIRFRIRWTAVRRNRAKAVWAAEEKLQVNIQWIAANLSERLRVTCALPPYFTRLRVKSRSYLSSVLAN